MAGEAVKFALDFEPPLDPTLTFALSRTKVGLEDLRELFAQFDPIFRGQMKEQFATQGEWGAGGWADLSDAYAIWKERHFPGRPIGYLRGHLRAALTGGAGYRAEYDRTSASFGLDFGPAKQYGRYFAERRPVIAFPRSAQTAYAKAAQRHVIGVAQQAFRGM